MSHNLTTTSQVALDGMETSPILGPLRGLLVVQILIVSMTAPLHHLFGMQKHSEVAEKLSSAEETSSVRHCPSECPS